MRISLVTRFPRVDTPAWKRKLAEALLGDGFQLSVVYSRSTLVDQFRAGLGEFGPGLMRRYLSLSGRSEPPGQTRPAPVETLAGWAQRRGVEVGRCGRLDDADCLATLRRLAPDILVLAGSDIVPASVLGVPSRGTINGHYGLLPRYRGMNVTEWSIWHDDPVGVSVHMVDPGIDTGDVLLTEPVEAVVGDTLETLRGKHQRVCGGLLLEAARSLRAGTERPARQDPAAGRQFYRMHSHLRDVVERKLARGEYSWLGDGQGTP